MSKKPGWGGGGPGIGPHHPVHHKQAVPHRKPPKAHKKPAPSKKPKPPPPHKKPRQLSPGSDVACCSALALGTLLGWDWDQVLGLYWRTASDPDSGTSILDTLKAAPNLQVFRPELIGRTADCKFPLILGVELPGPHAIAVTPDGTWWSWGEPFHPHEWPDLIVEEAWCLR